MGILKYILSFSLLFSTTFFYAYDKTNEIPKKLVYIVSDIQIPFWQIMSKGIKTTANNLGYSVLVYSASNSAKKELENTIKAIKNDVAGIIVSPTNSSACVTILKLAKRANIPVVISDIGTDAGEYVSYISSHNFNGAYGIGKILANKMIQNGWQDGRVGIIAIPQKRLNGQQRTAGFLKALKESNIKGAQIRQFEKWTDKESYDFTKDMIEQYSDLKAIWLQTSHSYKSVMQAIKDKKKIKDILLVSFDAEPEFIEMIQNKQLLASAMQQPYLMGKESILTMHKYLMGQKVKQNIQLPILSISHNNITKELPNIRLNVLGIEQ